MRETIGTAPVDGARIAYRVDGPADAPVLVLGNSLGTNLHMWDAQIAAFSKRFRVLRYDSRGHGASDVAPGPYDIPRLGRDVIALLDHLAIGRAIFCGLSMGGVVGMWLGVRAPERFERLILCNTGARIGTAEMWNKRIAAVGDRGMAAIAPAVLERWFTAGFRARSPEIVAPLRDMLEATSVEGYCASCAAVRDADLREEIAGIAAPTLVIAGTHDMATPPDHGRLVAERVRGSRYVELDAGHLSNVEQPEPFTRNVLEFAG